MTTSSTPLRSGHFSLLLVASTLAWAGSSMAQQSPLYIGASVGQSTVDFDFRRQVSVLSEGFLPVTQASLVDDKDSAYKLTIGYRFTPQIAVELDYVDLGETRNSYEFNGLGRFPRQGTYKVDGFNVSGVFSVPLNERFSAFGRVGVLYSQYKYSETGQNFPAFQPSDIPPIHSFTAPNLKRAKLSYGLGADYNVNANVAIRLGWDRYTDIGNTIADNENSNGKFDVDLFSLGVMYRF